MYGSSADIKKTHKSPNSLALHTHEFFLVAAGLLSAQSGNQLIKSGASDRG